MFIHIFLNFFFANTCFDKSMEKGGKPWNPWPLPSLALSLLPQNPMVPGKKG